MGIPTFMIPITPSPARGFFFARSTAMIAYGSFSAKAEVHDLVVNFRSLPFADISVCIHRPCAVLCGRSGGMMGSASLCPATPSLHSWSIVQARTWTPPPSLPCYERNQFPGERKCKTPRGQAQYLPCPRRQMPRLGNDM